MSSENKVAACTLVLCLCGCTPLAPMERRPAPSTLGCVQRVLEEKLPAHTTDDAVHCVAAGLIARYCSLGEAYVASIGKELKDAFGPGDFEWRDWQADRRGIACAKHAGGDDEVYACCGLSSDGTRAPP
jgi:hypothetical protein